MEEWRAGYADGDSKGGDGKSKRERERKDGKKSTKTVENEKKVKCSKQMHRLFLLLYEQTTSECCHFYYPVSIHIFTCSKELLVIVFFNAGVIFRPFF